MNTQSPPSDRVNKHQSSSKKKRDKKDTSSNVAQKNKPSLVILDDTDDEEFEEMMSYSFTKVNNTEKGREKYRQDFREISETNPTHSSTTNVLKDNQKSNVTVEKKVDDKVKEKDASSKNKVKEKDASSKKEHVVPEKCKVAESDVQSKNSNQEKKRKAPDSPHILAIETANDKDSRKTSAGETNCKKSTKNDAIPTTATGAMKPTANPDAKKETVDNINSSEPVIKKKKITFQDQVLQHLLTSMKPFTLKTLATDMKTTDVALHNLMLSLVDKKIVLRKEFNKGGDGEKQKRSKEIYWLDMDRATQALQGSTTGIQSYSESERKKAIEGKTRLLSEEAMIRKEIHDLTNVVPMEIIRKKVDEEELLVKNLKQRLDEIKNQNGKKVVAKTCPKAMQKKITALKCDWKKRKQQCMDFVENIADAMEKKKKDVLKDLQLDLDN